MVKKLKGTKAARRKCATARALALQAAGAAARRNAAGDKILNGLHKLEGQIKRREFSGIPTYADILRLADVTRKTLFADAHADKLALADQLLLKAGNNLRKPKVSKPTGLTHYQKVSVNAQEAEAVRIRKQAEIDALQKKLHSAQQEILALRAAKAITASSVRPHRQVIRRGDSDAMHM
jgi:hypothetical protein